MRGFTFWHRMSDGGSVLNRLYGGRRLSLVSMGRHLDSRICMEVKQIGLWLLVRILRGPEKEAALSPHFLRNPTARWRADCPVGKGGR